MNIVCTVRVGYETVVQRDPCVSSNTMNVTVDGSRQFEARYFTTIDQVCV
jgi:hypothetical protein